MTNYENVLNHLMFHKALLNDHEAGERIGRYLQMVQEIEQGHYLAVRDPMEKAIAAAFELVLEHQFNPWEIDLAAFTKLYLEKVRDDGVVNFVTAGKLVAMAWTILKLQSDELLGRAEPPQQPEAFFSDWDLGLDVYDTPEQFDYTQAILQGRIPLQEAIRREGKRAVTLMELMQAFDEARVEAARQLELAALREKNRATAPKDFGNKVHGEDLNEDLALTWSRILESNGGSIPLAALADHDRWERVTVFVAVLFLAKMEKITLYQENFPYGEIFVKRISSEETLEPVPAHKPAEEVAA
ncbi:MAG: segregation/condensation protein A [Euryarchaeota archaeon]|nr:segregation/condensation protein A [Euryarchaeota archaeon]